MSFNIAGWICPVCRRAPSVTVELRCPDCDQHICQDFGIDFHPSGVDDTDHNRHLAAENREVRSRLRLEAIGGTVTEYIPDFFKDHIRLHEERAFKSGAASREVEIRNRIDELNKRAESILADLTAEFLLKRQQQCDHRAEHRWLAAESGKMNLLCSGCFKVLDVKFVGSSTAREAFGLKIVTEK